ncbi:phage tail sheath family protein [Clostridium magnum]|uniref:Phage tail sheath protein n=1 Tax=Clostridium magnum DSM 2767 TaxID=1121326 RepID=A0A161WJQ2_9CLOT|nr:phage tail sheath family protein [Clostridium magnum]KZL88713.1 hypothetical protein CLMAG_60020 [Clostridium magnum DSM 2767]SHJ44151.1 hypothetical protein SAMN02745944_05968 [Clostridium magnum DSM 2767]
MSYQHGVYIQENATPVTPPITADCGIQVAVGTAPVNLASDPEGAVNKPILCYSLGEAVGGVGYCEDFKNYTLCQSIDATFNIFNVAPIILINVLDPTVHKSVVDPQVLSIVNGVVNVNVFGVMLDNTFIVKDSTGTTAYVKDTDYSVAFDKNGYPVITVLKSGAIPTGATQLQVTCNKIDPSKVTKDDIIGGYDVSTNLYSGLELINQVYPKLGIVPGTLIAPGWSHDPEVAAVMNAKIEGINGSFNGETVVDVDTTACKKYTDVPSWKSLNGYTGKRQFSMWPKIKVGSKQYYYSAIFAALIQYTDANSKGVPYRSPSNKLMAISGTVLEDGTEVFLDQLQANFLNGNGIVTAININGWRSWGNNTSIYPASSDPKDRFIPIRRIFDWWGNTFILTYFQKVDDPTNYRLIESVVDSENIRGNGFQAAGQIAGAKIEFRSKDNPLTDILNGKIQFIQKIAAFPPAENIINVLEFDPSTLQASLGGGN